MSNDPNPDTTTLNSLKLGDNKAFEAIFRKYNKRVYNFVVSTLYDKDIAEDITQSVFLSIWEHRENIDPSRNFQAYVFTIAKNMVYRHTENMLRNYRFEEYVRSHVIHNDTSHEERIDAGMLEDEIMRMIEQLPEARKRIFIMSFKEELTNKEIAEQLSISPKTVDTQIRRSLDFIRKNLKSGISAIALFHIMLPW